MSELSEFSGECDGCGEYNDDCICESFYEPPSFGCCLDDCVMPFPHFESECHNAEMMQEQEIIENG